MENDNCIVHSARNMDISSAENVYMEPIPTLQQTTDNIEEKYVDSDIQDEDNDEEGKENFESFNGTGRTVTLQMLMSANVLQPGKSLMTIEYLGQKFVGDLLSDGKIKSHETETIFLTPSAWAMHCKRIINPEKKSGCGWASVKYKGKKLDIYKNSWLRKCAMQKDSALDWSETDVNKKSNSPLVIVKRIVYPYNSASIRNIAHDASTLIETVSFSSLGKMQPFFVTVNSSALLLADFHCHLTMREVCGYLGGHWDINTHTLQISKVYPCCNVVSDRQKATLVESKIQQSMLNDQLLLVGWYHSHPKFQAEPTLRDCDSQLNYQIRMRGPNETTYTPCVSLIISPFFEDNPTLESVIKVFWVVPPCENKQSLEYGRPMLMQYSIIHDKEMPEEMRNEIQICVNYYSKFRNELIKFNNFFNGEVTYIEKLKNSLFAKFPIKQNNKTLWNWICAVLGCEQEDIFLPPKTIKLIDNNTVTPIIKSSSDKLILDMRKDELSYKSLPLSNNCERKVGKQSQIDQKTNEMKILTLQEQLCLPSGLNMNPLRMISPQAAPNTVNASTVALTTSVCTMATTSVTTELLPPLPQIVPYSINMIPTPVNFTTTLSGTASPRDSPITIPSSSASPAKFEIPVRATPSPVKSDTSSQTSRTRNSPTPTSSPGKFAIGDIARNSPSITPNKYDSTSTSISPSATGLSTATDLVAASLAQLTGQFSPNVFQGEIATIFQQRKDCGNSSLNQLAAAAAKVGNQKIPQSLVSGLNDYDLSEIAPVNSFSNNFNLANVHDSLVQSQTSLGNRNKSDRSSKLPLSFSSNTPASYKTKLMKELDDLKNDPMKVTELMRSPEYAALLLQQAEALGATTLSTLGLGSDFSYLAGTPLGLPTNNSASSCGNKSKTNSTLVVSSPVDYSNVIQASKLLGYDSYIQQAKSNDLNIFLQQQMGTRATSSSSSSSKKQQYQPHADYSSLLQTYSKIFDVNNQIATVARGGKLSNNSQHELSSLLTTGENITSGGALTTPTSKQKSKDTSQVQQHSEMLNQLLQTENALIYHQNKPAADLNTVFATPTSVNQSYKPLVADTSSLNDSNFCSVLAQEKLQDYASFFQAQGKHDNSILISPTTFLKIQQESISAMMMKPPKTASATNLGSRTRDASVSPAIEHFPSTKGMVGSGNASCVTNPKYNFSAIDLAISSVPVSKSSPAPSDSSLSSLRRPSNTPPVDFSRLYGELTGITKKRMEFSSIAELAAPPPAKIPKENDDVLNLSNE